MPIYIEASRVDWGWADRSEAERAIIRRNQADLSDSDHGVESFEEGLSEASQELPGVSITAAVRDDTGAETLFLARDGEVITIDVTADTAASKEHLALIAALWKKSPEDLFPTQVTARDRAAAGGEKVEQVLYFAKPQLEYLKKETMRLDRSLSWVVQRSWTDARETIRGLASAADAEKVGLRPGTAKQKQNQRQKLFFPGAMLVQIEDEATRLNRSMSWLVQLAIDVARPELAKLPSFDAGED